MKKIILLLLLCIRLNEVHAQQNEKDSLKHLLQIEKADTGRVLILAELSFLYSESKPDTTMLMALEALTLARKIGFIKGEAESLNRIGNAYHTWGNYTKAMEIWLQSLKLNEKVNNLLGIQRNYNNIGSVNNFMGEYKAAHDYYQKARAISEKTGNKRSLSIQLGNIGENYYQQQIYDSARIYAEQAFNVASGIHYWRIMGTALSYRGDIHFELKQHTLALEYYRLAIPYLLEASNFIRLSTTYLGMAKVFEETGQSDSALHCARQSMSIARINPFSVQVRNTARFLSLFYRRKQLHDSAYFYQDVSKTVNDSLFGQQKNNQFQSLALDEKLRQADLEAAELKTKEERNHNLQYVAIAIGLISFIIFFFALSRSIIVKPKFIAFFTVLGLLAVFEFINLFIHPYLAGLTNNSPVLMLIILITIGALLIPLHHKLEKWITGIMIEKNKKIRLEAAKKTIEMLER